MTKIGTTFTNSGKKAVLCGSGELGKEVALELQRYGVEVVALAPCLTKSMVTKEPRTKITA